MSIKKVTGYFDRGLFKDVQSSMDPRTLDQWIETLSKARSLSETNVKRLIDLV